MLKRSQQLNRWIDLSSLQVRLALGVAVLATLSIGSMSTWMGWKTGQILVGRHIRQVANVVEQIPQDIQRYRPGMSLDAAIQKVIDLRSFSDMSVIVLLDGEITTRSDNAIQDRPIIDRLMTRMDDAAMVPADAVKTSILRIDNRDYLVCSGPLQINQEVAEIDQADAVADSGTLYVFLDITEDRARLMALVRSLGIATLLTLLGLVGAVALYVRRSLRPLRQMSQITSHLKLEELGHVRVRLENAPTEVSELVETCEDMLSRLAGVLEQQRQFTHDISHELRTPLTISYGYLQSLQRRSSNLKPAQREALATAIEETEHSIAILEDLLNLARADSGNIQFSLSDVSVLALVQAVAHSIEVSSRRSIVVDTSGLSRLSQTGTGNGAASQPTDAETTLVRADPERLRQVLVKLLDNALRYSNPDQPVTLRLAQSDSSVIIRVCDRGIGIPLPDQQRIFDRCYRVDAARNRTTGGSGLGLSLVKTLIEGMGGQISVSSKPNEGSIFTVSLPLILDANETSHHSRRRRRKTGSIH